MDMNKTPQNMEWLISTNSFAKTKSKTKKKNSKIYTTI